MNWSGVDLNQLPCGGCHFCTRAKQQWSTFENDIDYVVPLTTGAVDNLDLNTIPLGLSDIFVLDELTWENKMRMKKYTKSNHG